MALSSVPDVRNPLPEGGLVHRMHQPKYFVFLYGNRATAKKRRRAFLSYQLLIQLDLFAFLFKYCKAMIKN